MSLETITGNLQLGYEKLVSGTMLSAHQLMSERRNSSAFKHESFYTSDGVVYFLNGADKVPTLAMTGENCNPVLRNIGTAYKELTKGNNYYVSPQDLEIILADSNTALVSLPSLRLSKDSSEVSYLDIEFFLDQVMNDDERKLAKRIYGPRGEDYVGNMAMIQHARVTIPRIYVLSPDYIREHAQKGAIARASILSGLLNGPFYTGDCSFNAIGNSHITTSLSLRGELRT